MVGATGTVFVTMGAKTSSLIFETEVEKLRPAAWELREVCADYLMSPSDRLLTMKFARVIKDFPDLSYVFFVDRNGETHYRGSSKVMSPLKDRLVALGPTQEDVNAIRIGGETYVDIGDLTRTVPPMPVHVGFAKSLTRARTLRLLWNRAVIALVVLAGGLVGGFSFLTWVTRPVMDVSSQAERLSLGEMDVKLDLKCRGEIGRVYHSLERIRESMLYALRRLNDKEQGIGPQAEQETREEEMPAGGERKWPTLR